MGHLSQWRADRTGAEGHRSGLAGLVSSRYIPPITQQDRHLATFLESRQCQLHQLSQTQ